MEKATFSSRLGEKREAYQEKEKKLWSITEIG